MVCNAWKHNIYDTGNFNKIRPMIILLMCTESQQNIIVGPYKRECTKAEFKALYLAKVDHRKGFKFPPPTSLF